MALKENGLFGTIDKVAYAIKQIQLHEPKEGYYVAFSGGKDSEVVLDLVKKSGVKYDAHHNITNVEPPEVIYFIRDNYPEVINEQYKKTMWELIIDQRLPPMRTARYCCKYLKERGGEGRYCITGIRQEESVKRSKRQMVEPCARNRGKRFLNPIIDWKEEDVWQYIHDNNMPYCKLYDEGRRRVGCLFCPFESHKQKILDAENYPKFKNQFVRTFDKLIQFRTTHGLENKWKWKTGEQMFDWWIGTTSIEDEGLQGLLFV